VWRDRVYCIPILRGSTDSGTRRALDSVAKMSRPGALSRTSKRACSIGEQLKASREGSRVHKYLVPEQRPEGLLT
jgi:hypothetical protein